MKRDLDLSVLADLVARAQVVVQAAGVPVALDLVEADAYLQDLTDLDLTGEVEDHSQEDLVLEEVGLMAPLGQVAAEDFPLMDLAQEEVGLARDGVEDIQATTVALIEVDQEVDQEDAGLEEEATDRTGVIVQMVPEESSKLMKDLSIIKYPPSQASKINDE